MTAFRFFPGHAARAAVLLGLLATNGLDGVRAGEILDPAIVQQLLQQTGGAPAPAPALPAAPEGLFALYEQNRNDDRPHYITVDLLLVTYSLIRQTTQAEFERDPAKYAH